jgi:hypothetical protein
MTDTRKFEHLLPQVKVSLINEPIEPEPEPEPKSARERANRRWRMDERTM